MKKSIVSIAIAGALGTASFSAQANLITSATLNFTAGTVGGLSTSPPAVGTGSWFGMKNGDADFNGIDDSTLYTTVSSNNGLHIGVMQAASGNHSFAPGCDPSSGACTGGGGPGEAPNIDNPWSFFGSTGMHNTTSPITVKTDSGVTKILDFSGWNVNWNQIASIPMGGDTTNFAGDDGEGTIVCSTASCSNGSTFVLDYSGHVPVGDASGFGGVKYTFHLEGTISAPSTTTTTTAAPTTTTTTAAATTTTTTMPPAPTTTTTTAATTTTTAATTTTTAATTTTTGAATTTTTGAATTTTTAATTTTGAATTTTTGATTTTTGATTTTTGATTTTTGATTTTTGATTTTTGATTTTSTTTTAPTTTTTTTVPIPGPGIPTVTSKITTDTQPSFLGTFDATNTTILTVTVDGLTYTLGMDAALTNGGSIWNLDLSHPSALQTLAINTYEVVVTAENAGGGISVDESTLELEVVAAPTTTTAAPTTTTTTVAPPTTTTTTVAPPTTTTTTVAPPTTTTTTVAPPTTTTTTTAAPPTTTTTTVPTLGMDEAAQILGMQDGNMVSEVNIEGSDLMLYVTKDCPDGVWAASDDSLGIGSTTGPTAIVTTEQFPDVDGTVLTAAVACSPVGTKDFRFVIPTPLGSGDTDGDGIPDNQEPFDENNNGLPDYLESTANTPTVIPLDGNDASLGKVVISGGTSLTMGPTAFGQNKPGVGVDASDIEDNNTSGGGFATDGDVAESCIGGCISVKINGVTPGDSVKITYPLIGATIPVGAVYRKFFPDTGWQDFDTSTGDTIGSAAKTSGNNCPPPGDAAYNTGPTAGDACIQLMIEDGGPNDTDGEVNGMVVDPHSVSQSDDTAPVITVLEDDDPTLVAKGSNYVDAGATALDDHDGDVTTDIVVVSNVNEDVPDDYTVLYVVSDTAGNEAREERDVTVLPDTTKPVITLDGDNPDKVLNNGAFYIDPGFTATDDADGNITNQVAVGGDTVDTSTVGTYNISYNVTDSSGNVANTVARSVVVKSNSNGGSGCAASPVPVAPASRGDWWLVGGLFAWLGVMLRRRRRD